MINEIFERELRNTSINGITLADYIKENYIPKTDMWIPVSEEMPKERLPKPYQDILVTVEDFRFANEPVRYSVCQKSFDGSLNFIAWMPLPEPFLPTEICSRK